MTPSPQQAAFYDWISNGTGSCVLEAVAGAGKTTTLIQALLLMSGSVFFGAYNKAIATEIASRVPDDVVAKVEASTFHAAGFRAWRRVARDVKVDANKCRNLFRRLCGDKWDLRQHEGAVLKLVSLAKQAGVGVTISENDVDAWTAMAEHYSVEAKDGKDALVLSMARRLLEQSIDIDREEIDFDDMIYTPLLRNAKIWQHDWVLIDEAQDTNATRRELALRMLKDGGRLVAVGDPRQAIYGFTGADSDSMDIIAAATNAVRMPLTVTYRCPKAIVSYARNWVSHIEAHESAPNGDVVEEELESLAKVARPGDAVLCRFNAPLVKNVYSFIAAGIPARIEGRDIADGLVKLARKWGTNVLVELEDYLSDYLTRETARLIAKDEEHKVANVEDKVQCLQVLIDRVRGQDSSATVDTLVGEIGSIFGPEGENRDMVTFCSVHKSKGREWHKVVWLQTGPSPWARKPWELGQEDNLCYVAATRAKSTLVLIAV